MDANTRKRYLTWQRRKIIKRLVVLVVLLGISIGGHFAFEQVREWNNEPELAIDDVILIPVPDPLTYDEVEFSMNSQNALLLNLSNGRVLFEHGANERVYPASLTKIMTIILAIEQFSGQTMIVNADFDALLIAGASVAGFSPGEVRTLSEILHGAMLSSGADATATIAHNIAGSYEAFVALMNERARELGMSNTNFTNASGLHHPNHYTTTTDIAILLHHALENPIFREIFTAQHYSFTNWAGEYRVMQSTLFANMSNYRFSGGRIIGGRTGFTNEAGRCLASLATDGTDDYLLITLGANSAAGDFPHITDALMIFEYFLRP